jgi:hypothetical protein
MTPQQRTDIARYLDAFDFSGLFSDGRAYPETAQYFNTLDDLERIDWPLLEARDSRYDPEVPGKKER